MGCGSSAAPVKETAPAESGGAGGLGGRKHVKDGGDKAAVLAVVPAIAWGADPVQALSRGAAGAAAEPAAAPAGPAPYVVVAAEPAAAPAGASSEELRHAAAARIQAAHRAAAQARSRGAAEATAEPAAAPAGPAPDVVAAEPAAAPAGTSSEELRHAAAARIQAAHRGRTTHRRFQEEVARLVPRDHAEDGCIYWYVALAKAHPMERYGFSHTADGSEFSCARGALETPRAPNFLMVKTLAPAGLLALWNDDHPEAEVMSTDRIVEVNGIADDPIEMQAQLATGSIRMRMCRYPARFSVRLARGEGQIFGVKFKAEAEEIGSSVACLQVQDVHPQGLLEVHNRAQISRGHFHYVVTKGMSIEAVNDARGNAEKLIESLRTCADAQLVIHRGEVVSLARGTAKLQMRATLALDDVWDGLPHARRFAADL